MEAYSVTYDEIDYSSGMELDCKEPVASGAADEALVSCLNEFGAVDLGIMSETSGLTVEELVRELRGKAIFQDPEEFYGRSRWSAMDGWYAAPVYLSGNVASKLKQAETMNKRFSGCFDDNIKALKAMLPSRVSSDSIHPSLGATWLPGRIFAAFIKKLLKLRETPDVTYSSELGEWKIKPPYGVNSSIENTYTYGTKDISAISIIAKTMNAQTVKVYDHEYALSGRCESILNEKKTIEAQDKQRLIISHFDEWVRSDPELERRIENHYNDAFVGYATSTYDGSFLALPDLNPEIKLYPHQRNVIARILLSGTNLMLAHDVGTGKTYEMVVSAHELHRMGLSGKNLIVVPNNVLKATVDAHRLLYPNDDILAIFPTDFTPAKRKEALRKIRDEDHVCVFMAYSSFDMINMSKSYWIRKMQSDIAALEREAFSMSYGYTKNSIKREIESRKDTELAFETWCSVYNKLPSAEEILAGRCRTYPQKLDELYALSSGLASILIGKGDSLRSGELENACVYASRFPMDFAMSFFSDLRDNEIVGKMLIRSRAFNQWILTSKSAV